MFQAPACLGGYAAEPPCIWAIMIYFKDRDGIDRSLQWFLFEQNQRGRAYWSKAEHFCDA